MNQIDESNRRDVVFAPRRRAWPPQPNGAVPMA